MDDYKAKHNPIQPPDDPVEIILVYRDLKGLSGKDKEQYLGDKDRVSDILNHRRSLSRLMIHRLGQRPGIPNAVVLSPTE
jgi:antitoxin component HigA of HigAB toxin-antitoxin module